MLRLAATIITIITIVALSCLTVAAEFISSLEVDRKRRHVTPLRAYFGDER